MDLVHALKDVFVSSGAGWVLGLLGLSSLVTAFVVVERLLFYREILGRELPALLAFVQARFEGKDQDGVRQRLAASKALEAFVALAAFDAMPRGLEAAERAVAAATAMQRERLEARLTVLGTIGSNAPFVGLLGTVIGIIEAFDALGLKGAFGASAAGEAQQASALVMASIAEALVTTAVGLLVAIPATVAYNGFHRRIERSLSAAEALSNTVLSHLLRPCDATPEVEHGQTHVHGHAHHALPKSHIER